jgi:hypothetical protein
MKPIPLEDLARLLGPNAEISSAEPAATVQEEPRQMLLPLEAVASLSERRTASHIVDITDQYIGKSLIITGASKPEDSQ